MEAQLYERVVALRRFLLFEAATMSCSSIRVLAAWLQKGVRNGGMYSMTQHLTVRIGQPSVSSVPTISLLGSG